MMPRPKRPPYRWTGSDRRAGFTLIEIVAVVAIMAMVFGIGLPRLVRSPWGDLEDEAEQIAQTLRFARQRAIMTGIPHRLLIDLEEGGYLIEWFVVEDDSGGDSGGLAAALFGGGALETDDSDERAPIDLHPPRRAERDYRPIPHSSMGTFRWLDEAHYFVGVDGPSGWVEGGDYAIVFGADGMTDLAILQIADAEDHRLVLEIEPLLQQVRIRREGADS